MANDWMHDSEFGVRCYCLCCFTFLAVVASVFIKDSFAVVEGLAIEPVSVTSWVDGSCAVARFCEVVVYERVVVYLRVIDVIIIDIDKWCNSMNEYVQNVPFLC